MPEPKSNSSNKRKPVAKKPTTKPTAKKKATANPFTKSQIQQKVYHVDKRKGFKRS